MRIVYVNPADPGNASLAELVEAWWSTRETMAAVAADGAHEVLVVLRTRREPGEVSIDRVRYVAIHDDTRSGAPTARRVRALRPDVIHANGFVFPLRTATLRLVNPRTPLLVQHHGERPAPQRSPTGRAQRVVGRIVDGVLFTGATTGASEPWERAGVLRARTPRHEVVETVVRFPPLPAGAPAGPPPVTGAPAVLWVGRADPVKDPLGAVAAFEILAATAPGARLTMVSSGGALADELTRRVMDSLYADRITLTGPLPRDALPAWYAAADVFVSTSRSEGSGFALLEALTCGCPAVAVTDLPSHRAILGRGPTGGGDGPPEPPPGDPVAMAAHLRAVVAGARPTPTPPDAAGQLAAAYRAAATGTSQRRRFRPQRL